MRHIPKLFCRTKAILQKKKVIQTSEQLAVVNETTEKKRWRPFLFLFSRFTLLSRSRVSFSFCWYSPSFLYLQTEQRQWSSVAHPAANCVFICTIMHNTCLTLKRNMNLEWGQKIYLCISITFFFFFSSISFLFISWRMNSQCFSHLFQHDSESQQEGLTQGIWPGTRWKNLTEQRKGFDLVLWIPNFPFFWIP